MKTFIFGAGASVHAGYPLATQLRLDMERWAKTNYSEDHRFREAVRSMHDAFGPEPFESVLTLLNERIELLSTIETRTDQETIEKFHSFQLRDTVKEMLCEFFDSLREQPADLYSIFANDILEPEDSVITLNYDLLLERKAKRAGKWSVGTGYGFEIPGFEDSPCKILKLHGSTNWCGELFQGFLGGIVQSNLPSLGYRPGIPKAEFDFLGYENASDPEYHEGKVKIRAFILPAANKQFFVNASDGRQWKEFWDSLWSQAGHALKRSEEVYLIGYSIPENDSRVRELIRSEVRSDVPVKICCHSGTDDIVRSLRELGKNAQSAEHPTFERLMASMKNCSAASGASQ
jgi:hypothetical protein